MGERETETWRVARLLGVRIGRFVVCGKAPKTVSVAATEGRMAEI